MRTHTKSFVAVAIAGLLSWSLLSSTPASAYSYTERYLKNRLFTVNNYRIKSRMLMGMDAGTAIALAGSGLDINPAGLAAADTGDDSKKMSAGANVANGVLGILAENSMNRRALLKAGAALVDSYKLDLPAGVNMQDLYVRIDYDGILNSRQMQVKIELLGDKGMQRKFFRGADANIQDTFQARLVDLVKNPAEAFTLGFLASVTSRGKNCLADFNNSFSIHFLTADGQPLGVSSTGGFQQVSAVPIPQSLVLFGSAIIGLIGLRKRSLARHFG